MFIVLSGARQNAGDFLITERAKKLIRRFSPEEELFQLPGNEPLDDHLEKVNQSTGVIILGGPGCRPEMYPAIYPLVRNLDEITCPLYLMGSGWKGADGSVRTVGDYKFSESSKALLERISESPAGLSVRDHLTRYALQENGIGNIRMTGCPAWYDLDFIGNDYTPPMEIEKVCFTPAVSPELFEQSLAVSKEVVKLFPKGEKLACFHHGFEYIGKSGNERFFNNQKKLRRELSSIGYEPIDLSEGANFDVYDDCSLHFGYRVHAHIYMLSHRRTSFLIYEDGRGIGVDDALRIPGIEGFESVLIESPETLLDRISRRKRRVHRRFLKVNSSAAMELSFLIDRALSGNFVDFVGYPKVIDGHWEIMKDFLLDILDRGNEQRGSGNGMEEDHDVRLPRVPSA